MEPFVETVVEDDRWLGLEGLALRAVRATFGLLGLPEVGLTLCVMGCDDGRIAGLNAQFRGKPVPTNVLSWPARDLTPDAVGAVPDRPEVGSAEAPESLGDIALAYETCAAEAAAAAKPMAQHVTHLIVHGLLHLLGYDHLTEPDAARMEALEVRILATLAIPDPYGDAET